MKAKNTFSLQSAQKGQLQQDDVFVDSSIVDFSSLTGMPSRRGLEKAVISAGQVVNVVSNSYGHLPNEDFFLKVEEQLIDADIKYDVRSINRENRSFAVDYILNDESFHLNVKSGKDIVKPMLRFANSYDGSTKTSGNFGFFRKVCDNGLHVIQEGLEGFSVKHHGSIAQVVLPEIADLITKFFDNQFYSLHKKFEVLAETVVPNIEDFVKDICAKTAIFKFESSEKNPEPGIRARTVIDIITKESNDLGVEPNLWLGYNAFNEILHGGGVQKSFEAQRVLDGKIFNQVLEFAN